MRAVVILPIVLLSSCGAGRLTHDDRMTIWAETLPAEQIDARVAFAGRNHLNLNVNVVRDAPEDTPDYVAALCATAEADDVALRLWPGLPQAEGYWPNQQNVTNYALYVDHLLDLADASCPRLAGIVVDMEMPIDRANALAAMQAAGTSQLEIVMWLLSGIDEAGYAAAKDAYAALVAHVHDRGYSVTLTTLPMNADDPLDGDETIGKALWTPVAGIPWDAVSFQVYRTIFDERFPRTDGMPYTSSLITSYGLTIRQYWGDAGGVDLGTTGTGIGVSHGLPDAAALQSDIAAALGVGIPPGRISIYSLEGLADKPDADAWVQLPAPQTLDVLGADDHIRTIFHLMDQLGN
jgi:hypothetical protein